MPARFRPRITYANVVSTLCLFILLGGTAWAVAANSVGTAQLKDKAVTNPKLAANSVGTGKVIDGSLLKQDFKPGELPPGLTPASFTGAGLADDPSATSCFGVGGALSGWYNYASDSTNTSSPYGRVGYYRDPLGFVHLRGTAEHCPAGTNGEITEVFTLPQGYRPPFQFQEAGVESSSTDAPTNVHIDAAGHVYAEAVHVVSLEGLNFRCGPSGSHGCP
jgi:hypothetical protein